MAKVASTTASGFAFLGRQKSSSNVTLTIVACALWKTQRNCHVDQQLSDRLTVPIDGFFRSSAVVSYGEAKALTREYLPFKLPSFPSPALILRHLSKPLRNMRRPFAWLPKSGLWGERPLKTRQERKAVVRNPSAIVLYAALIRLGWEGPSGVEFRNSVRARSPQLIC